MSLPYFKKYPRDFFEGTAGMPFDLKGAYNLILDLIYIHSGKLPDDPGYISGHLGCSVRKWNSLRKRLLELSKIKAKNEIISNLRADKEEIITRSYQDNQAQKRRGHNKNNDLPRTTDKPFARQPEPEKKKKSKPKKDIDGESVFDSRDPFANSDVEYVFDERQWFTENEILYLEETHPNIDVREKLENDGFRKWAFTKDPQLPLKPARNWFEKQARVAEAHDSLMEKYADGKKMTFGDMSHLTDALDNKGRTH